MSFGIPAALWLLPLALLPLLAIRRRPARRLPVATIDLWAMVAAREAAPLAHRARRQWIAVLQAAIAAALVIAIARPLWPSGPGSAAIVVDTSLSMSARSGGPPGRGESRLAQAAARASAWAAELPRGTRVRVMAASPSPYTLGDFPAHGSELARALAGLRTTDAGAALDTALQEARAARPAPGRLLVVTDAARPPGETAEWATVGAPAANLALVSLTARRTRADSGVAAVLAHVWNYSDAAAATTLTLSRGDGVLARQTFTIAPNAGATLSAALEDGSGIVTGRIDADDAIAGDNTRSTVVAPPLAIRVGVRDPLARNPLEQALRTRRGVTLVAGAAEPTAEVVVCTGCAAAPSTVPPGAGVLDVLAAPRDPEAVAPITLESAATLQAPSALEGVEAVVVVGPEPAAGTVVARAGGHPAIVAYEAQAHRVVELRLDLARSPLVLTPAFPILVADILDWLAGRDLERATYEAGQPVARLVPAGGDGDARVVGPDRTALAVAIDGRRVTVPPTAAAGVYVVERGTAAAPFVVNPATRGESDVSRDSGPGPGGGDSRAPAPAVNEVRVTPSDLSPYVLVGVVALMALEWRLRPGIWRSPRTAAAALLAIALLGPRLPWGEAPRAIAFALDGSDSMAARRDGAMSAVARGTAGMRSDDSAALIVFGADAVLERPLERAPLGGTAPRARTVATATNLEQALRTARGVLPADGARRVVLVSDGRETAGDVRIEALAARAAGVPIDVVALQAAARLERRPMVTRLTAPPAVREREPFDIAAAVEGTPGSTAAVVFESAGAVLERRQVAIPASGAATVSLTIRPEQPGLAVYRAFVDGSELLADVSSDEAGAIVAVEGEPRLLIVSDAAAPAFVPAGYRVVTTTPEALPSASGAVAPFDAVILDDVDPARVNLAQRRALAQHVEQGGGLFVLGSVRSLMPLGSDDPLEAALPVDLRPRRGGRSPGLALVIVFDKSGSMDDRIEGAPKIEFARQAVQRVLGSLPPTDAVGVIAFDAAAVDVAALRPGHDAAALAGRLGAVRPSGATALAPALERAVAWLAAPAASAYARRLVLLVSDGRTSPADQARARAALRAGIELSTVALGDEADRGFLGDMARTGGGRAFYPRRLGELPGLAAREAVRVSGGRVVEEAFTLQPGAHAMLAGLDLAALPRLGGYVVSTPKTGASVALRSPLGDPILAAWQRGLGKVAVYTADLRSSWSAGLRRWPEGAALLAQTVRWISRRVDHPFLHVEAAEGDGRLRLTVDARAADGTFLNGLDVRAAGRAPDGRAADIALTPSAPGLYAGTAALAGPGPYTFAIAATSPDGLLDARVQRGVYWTAPRERSGEIDRARLAAIARLSGGRELGAGESPFEGERPRGRLELRPLLAAAAVLAFLAHALGVTRRRVTSSSTPSARAREQDAA